jgi:hypothetical protein
MSGSDTEAVVEGTVVATALDRQVATAQWLLQAAEDPEVAQRQWESQDLALLACGGLISAIKAPARLVWAAAGSDDLSRVDAYLRRFLDGGGVVLDIHCHLYYFLVPGSTKWEATHRDVEYLGRDVSRRHVMGVPPLRLTKPEGRSYWSVPLDAPGDLLYADEVAQLLREGRRKAGAIAGGTR